MSSRARVALRIAVVVLVVLVVACGDNTGKNQPGTAASQTELELSYGRAAVADPSVTYQPDVVIVGGGPAMVRGVSADTLTWTIAGDAPHVREAAVQGKVLFLTSMAVGRVIAVAPRGSDVKVTLAPIQITELIRDGTIAFNQSLDPSAMVMQAFPGVPGAVDERTPAPSPGGGLALSTAGAEPAAEVVRLPEVRLAGVAVGSLPPVTHGQTLKASVGRYEVEVARSGTAAGGFFKAKFSYKNPLSVTMAFTLTVGYKNLKVTGKLPIANGVLQTARASVSGINSLRGEVVSGSVSGLFGNIRPRIEVPFDISEPIPGPVPLVATIKFRGILETAFSAKNSTLDFSGEMGLSGPAGFVYAKGSGLEVVQPAVHLVKKLGDSLAGVSVGITGVVVAGQIRFQLGVGIPAVQSGPFVGLTISFAVTHGSNAAIVQCWQTSVDVFAAMGISYTLAVPLGSLIERLSSFKWKTKIETDVVGGTVPVMPTLTAKGPQSIPACA